MIRRTCGKENCKCYLKGEKHSSLYLSQSKNGKTKMTYISKQFEKKIVEYINQYKRGQQNIENLSEINIKLLKLRKKDL